MTLNRSVLAGAAMAAAAFLATGAQAATITGLWDTGVNSLGAPLADGSVDTHWLVNGGSPFVYTHPLYKTTATDAKFIAAAADGAGGVTNTYTLDFSLAGLNPATASLSGLFEADNYATVLLNGNVIAKDFQGTVYSNFQSFSSFSAPAADFVSGMNVLKFTVTNTGGPSALLVSDLMGIAAVAGVPEPTTWSMMLLGFLGLGGVLRANRRKPVAATIA